MHDQHNTIVKTGGTKKGHVLLTSYVNFPMQYQWVNSWREGGGGGIPAGRKEGGGGGGKKSMKCGRRTPGWFLPVKQSPRVKTARVGVTIRHLLVRQCMCGKRSGVQKYWW